MHIHGSKKGSSQPRRPYIAPDDLVSVSYANIMYGLAEGEIFGLTEGGKSIKLDGTPLINDNGQPNFAGVHWEFRTGTLDQEHIAGFPAVENEINVGVELRSDRPWVKAITNHELSAVRVRLNFNALRQQHDNGDIGGYAIEYAIDVQTDGGSFVEVQRHAVRGKSSQGYKKSHRIDLPNAGTAKRWTIRVRRITPNRNSDLIGDTVHIDALTEIIDAKLAYPCTALLGLSYDAKTFANIAKIAVRLKGKIIQVPSNYNPETRQYNGLWDGTFKLAYSNNPAWVFYDLCTHKRYGLGERLATMVDKWRLYQIGQYCDELVDDGKGGQEPRFTCNVYIQKADDAYRVLQNLASVFRGLSFWDGSNIVVDADTPKESIYTFSPANVVGGEFAYTGTRARDRHTLAKVAWDNPENGFNTEYELIPDEQAITKYGVRTLDISAFGCTSKGQAQRAGLWALKAEQLETQTVSFKTGLMGFIPQVGQVINIADNVFAGRAVSGKIVAVSGNKRQITLDRTAGKVGDTITVNGTTGVQTAKISAVAQSKNGQVATLDKPINAEPEHIWAVISDDLKLKQFRILTIAQNDDATFDITALEYNAQKYRVVDNGAIVTPQPYTVLKATPITAPNSVTLTASTRTHQGQAITTLSINWEQVTGATAYIVEWRKDDGNWQTLPKVSGQSVDIDGVYSGSYTARVRAVDSYDNESLATSSQLTPIAGKTGKPPRLASLIVKGLLFGMALDWTFNKGSEDTNFTEIQVSPDGRSNITTLGTFAYPTNKHEITGLQGGLTQFYRGRIVDKLGNTSDWTAWVRGTTDNQAEKVLNLISGQINESHLHTALSTPIAKIGGLETAVNAVNGQLPTLNSQIATLNSKATTLQNELNTAKNTLQTATANITTERNRINTAIRDITTLQSANNAKTQEIANLVQTVGGHTSSIRELGVTTGDLNQKYTQLKTASDTANSEITTIKQTQAGQALSVERLGVRFDNLAVGGRNLLLNTQNPTYYRWANRGALSNTRLDISAVDNTSVGIFTAYQNLNLKQGQDYVISFDVDTDLSRLDYNYLLENDGNIRLPSSNIKQGRVVIKYTPSRDLNNVRLLVGGFKTAESSYLDVKNIKLETGQVATDWTPALEDLQSDIDSKTTTANLETLRQTLTNADTALSQQITAMDTAYKSADHQLTANLASETTARTSADNALGQRIDALQTDYNGNKASVANQLKTLSDKNTATASQISQLTANVSTAQQTANTVSGKADTATTKADNAQHTANNALTQANTANSAITAEQRARVDGDSSLASRITALNTAYKQADTDMTARIAREETARANGDNANAQALRTLESTVNGIGGRVGTSESKIASLERTTSDLNGAIATAQSQLNARFDNLAVGGRNLLLNTQNMAWGSWRQNDTIVANRLELTQPLFNLGMRTPYQAGLDFKDGEVITLSFEYRTDLDNLSYTYLLSRESGNMGGFSPMSINNDGQWHRATTTTTVKNNRVNCSILIGSTQSAGGVSLGKSGSHLEIKNIKLERGTIATDWTPAPEDVNVDLTPYATNASLNEFKQTQASKDTATAQKLSQLESGLGTKANATALDSLTTKVNQVDGKLTAETAKIATLQTTVNGQTTSIRNVEQSVNGVRAIKAVTVDNNGFISGYGLMSDLQNGRVTSRFGINADQIYFGATTSAKKPFIFATTPTTIDGVSYPAGAWFNSAHIARASINMLHIADSIQSDNYVAGQQGWRLFKNGELEINSSFGDGTRIQLNSRGLTGWYGNGQKAFELGILS